MKVLYQDKQVTITKEYMIIRKYYFPLATSKTIMFSDVQKFSLLDGTINTSWGLTRKWLNNWFPYDAYRQIKNQFLEITMKGKNIKPSITPDDIYAAYKVLFELFNKLPPNQGNKEENKKEQKDEIESVFASPAQIPLELPAQIALKPHAYVPVQQHVYVPLEQPAQLPLKPQAYVQVEDLQ